LGKDPLRGSGRNGFEGSGCSLAERKDAGGSDPEVRTEIDLDELRENSNGGALSFSFGMASLVVTVVSTVFHFFTLVGGMGLMPLTIQFL
jgi:hypothetical protein